MYFIVNSLLFWCALSHSADAGELYKIPLKNIEGKSTTLGAYRGKTLLIVNTASKCGYTPQYSGLEKIYEKYKERGLVVLGFPSNDFGGQEPGSNSQIRLFCSGHFHVSFPLFEKNPVKGAAIQPLYKEILKESTDQSDVAWNFEKFLISREGKVVARFRSGIEPSSDTLTSSIERELGR